MPFYNTNTQIEFWAPSLCLFCKDCRSYSIKHVLRENGLSVNITWHWTKALWGYPHQSKLCFVRPIARTLSYTEIFFFLPTRAIVLLTSKNVFFPKYSRYSVLLWQVGYMSQWITIILLKVYGNLLSIQVQCKQEIDSCARAVLI